MIAALAAIFILPFFSATAYACGEDENTEAVTIIEVLPEPEEIPKLQSIPATEYPAEEAKPFTPSGTGTVIDTASDADGKLFYTIMTPDEHIFYLVIDKQRGTENVYFLNAVTVADLMALAEIPETPQFATITTPPPTIAPETPPEPVPDPEQTGNNGTLIFVAVIIVLGGGAGWYIKIYCPKQKGAGSGEEYEPFVDEAETDYADDWDDEQDEDDSPPWDEGDK